MRNTLKHSHVIGFIFTIATGSLLHFLYKWSEGNPFIAGFAPVNESTWEHLKLLFFPVFIYSLFEFAYIGRNYKNYFMSMFTGILAGMAAIVVLFYTYSGIIGQNCVVMDILIFIIGVLVTYLLSCKLIINQRKFISNPWVGLFFLLVLVLIFVTFTYNPPHIPLFLDPVSQIFGI